MSACARCGLEWPTAGQLDGFGTCPRLDRAACRDRELSNLRSLLRSVTGKLEEARELLDPPHEPNCAKAAAALIDSVLEILS